MASRSFQNEQSLPLRGRKKLPVFSPAVVSGPPPTPGAGDKPVFVPSSWGGSIRHNTCRDDRPTHRHACPSGEDDEGVTTPMVSDRKDGGYNAELALAMME